MSTKSSVDKSLPMYLAMNFSCLLVCVLHTMLYSSEFFVLFWLLGAIFIIQSIEGSISYRLTQLRLFLYCAFFAFTEAGGTEAGICFMRKSAKHKNTWILPGPSVPGRQGSLEQRYTAGSQACGSLTKHFP